SSDAGIVLTVGDGVALRWDLRALPSVVRGYSRVASCAPDGEVVAFGEQDGRIRLFKTPRPDMAGVSSELVAFKDIVAYEGQSGKFSAISRLRFSRNGEYL